MKELIKPTKTEHKYNIDYYEECSAQCNKFCGNLLFPENSSRWNRSASTDDIYDEEILF